MPYLHTLDPVALQLGPVALRWYGLMYLAGFGAGLWLGNRRVRKGRLGITLDSYSDLMFYAMMGVILGGRVGYLLFYGLSNVIADPLSAFKVWDGGMSFHGGLLGVLAAVWWWSSREKLKFWDTVDFIAPLVPPGLGFVRIGNFINGELWGKLTHANWGVIFPSSLPEQMPSEALLAAHRAGLLDQYARHPTQLYEAALEGLVMFLFLFWFSARPRRRYAISGWFALLYGVFRFAVEFVRVPDAQLGYLFLDWVTMGQILSLPLIVTGVVLLILSRNAPYPRVGPPIVAAKPAEA